MINVFMYEDIGYKAVAPLTLARPVYDLRCGMLTLFEKAVHYFGGVNLTLLGRDYLKFQIKCAYPDFAVNHIIGGATGLFINGRVILSDELVHTFRLCGESQNIVFVANGEVVGFILKSDLLAQIKPLMLSIPDSAQLLNYLQPLAVVRELVDVMMIEHAHDLVRFNIDELKRDFVRKGLGGIIKGNLRPYVSIIGEANVYIGPNTTVEDFVFVDASNGPVVIDSDVLIEAHTRLEGPLYIGKGTRLMGGKISGSSIGQNCKVAGEMSHTIMLKNSNKAHAGYIGHSYLGEWVNLGANTTCSNLKNTYGSVKFNTGNDIVDTEMQNLGCIVGDHAKLGIQSAITTGSHIGFGASIYGTELHPNYVAPFSWGCPKQGYTRYQLDKFIETVKTVMKRRGVHPKIADIELLERIYNEEN